MKKFNVKKMINIGLEIGVDKGLSPKVLGPISTKLLRSLHRDLSVRLNTPIMDFIKKEMQNEP